MLGKDFVTITKTEDGDWDHVHKQASDTIEKHLTAGEVILIEGAVAMPAIRIRAKSKSEFSSFWTMKSARPLRWTGAM